MRFRSVVATASALAMLAAAPARHTALVKSEPAKDAVVTVAPSSLTLWFNEAVPVAATRVRLMRGGTAIALDAVSSRAADTSLVVPIRGALADGLYTVQWATASKDGHPVQGSYRFTLRRAP